MDTIPSWSHSRVVDFEKCNFLAKLKFVDKIPEPERPLPPGKSEHANDRGTRIHTACEEYINGKAKDLAPEADRAFGAYMDLLRVMFKDGLVSLEGEWAMNRDWDPCAWNGEWVEALPGAVRTGTAKKIPDRGKPGDIVQVGKQLIEWMPAWLRLKLDAMVMHSPRTATVIDFKTGKKFGNEIKHGEQLQLYALTTFLRYPDLEEVFAELWYIDQPEGNNITSKRYTRQQALMFKNAWTKRGLKVTTTTEFKPNPNRFSCQWCQYGPWNGGQCQVGVR
jgi:hypothetical protein